MFEQERNDSFRAERRAPTGSAQREKQALHPPAGRGLERVGATIPEMVSNPLFFSILEGLQTDYSVFDHQQVLRRRSRSHSPQEQQ